MKTFLTILAASVALAGCGGPKTGDELAYQQAKDTCRAELPPDGTFDYDTWRALRDACVRKLYAQHVMDSQPRP